MKKLLVVALLAVACSKAGPPSINVFTADRTDVAAGDPVIFTFDVKGATTITLTPDPGPVTTSPVTITAQTSGVYTLRAVNDAGATSKDITLNVTAPAIPAAIMAFGASPSQVPPGGQTTFSWLVSHAAKIVLSDGTPANTFDVTALTSKVVTVTASAAWTLTVTGPAATTPATVSAKATVRTAPLGDVVTFTASSTSINQGQPVTLTWTGGSISYSISDGMTTTALGPAKTLVVRPIAGTTYTLTGMGVGGAGAPKSVVILVTANAGATLKYTDPPGGGQLLRLVADAPACATPTACTITLHLRAATAGSLRGVALDLPLDSTKVTVDPASLVLSSSFITGALPAAKVTLGSALLKDTLVFGAARKGTGTAVAGDYSVTPGSELASFVVKLVPAGGKGVIFDGSSAFKARVQSAAGATAGGIAVGKLEAF